MNDPNGFCFYRGQYHLFYQYHPYSTSWGPMHWGHATSTDLLHWAYAPCALAPDTPADAGGCFSGSAVPLPDGRLMLAYTGVQPVGEGQPALQAQCVAVGDGLDFTKAPGNPVVRLDGLDAGYSRTDFRDPKAWLDADGRYYLVVACRHQDRQGAAMLFGSEDGLRWRFLRELDSSRGQYGNMWECPDFCSLDGRQVLLLSIMGMQAAGEFHTGSCTAALIGRYDQEKGFVRQAVQPVDLGLNFYAPQTTLAPDGRRIMMGWMDSWADSRKAPRRHAWYGRMSIPRELFLANGRLMQRPVHEMEALWQDTVVHRNVPILAEASLPGVQGRCLDMTVTLHTADSACRHFAMRLAKDAGHSVLIAWNAPAGILTFDRTQDGNDRDMAHTCCAQAAAHDGLLTLRLLLDQESVELFINDGERVLTCLTDAPRQAAGITFSADQPIRMDVIAHPLDRQG